MHRDIKPENILLSSIFYDANTKITDFGIARHTKTSKFELTDRAMTACGTPRYMAPEVIRVMQGKQIGYTEKIDMWSAGVMLYAMLSGKAPFEDQGLYEQITKGQNDFDIESGWGVV